MVTKKINDLVYRIQLSSGVKPKVVHRNRLWKYSGRNPTWYKQATDMERRQSPADIVPEREPEVTEEESDTENENSVPNPNTEQLRSTRTRRPLLVMMHQFKEGRV